MLTDKNWEKEETIQVMFGKGRATDIQRFGIKSIR